MFSKAVKQYWGNKGLLAGFWVGAACISPVSAEAITLEESLVAAYETNPQIKAEQKNLEKLNQRVGQALSGWRPTVTLSADKGRQRNRSTGAVWAYNDSEAIQLSLTQPLYNGGGTVAATDAAETRVEAGKNNLYSTEQEVLLQTVAAYLNLVRDHLLVDLSSNNERVLKEQLRATNERFEVGEVTRTDVAQAKARLARAKSDRIQAEGSLESTAANFTKLTGLVPEALATLDKAKVPGIPESLEAATETALKENHEYLASQQQIEAAKHDVNVAESGLLPRLSLLGIMRREEGAGVSGTLDFDNDSVTLNLEVPLYQGGRQYAVTREANQEVLRVEQAAAVTRNQLKENVARVWQRLQTAQSTIRSTEVAVKAAEVALEGVKQEQLYGARTTLDVLDAEQELFVANVELVRAKNEEMVARYNLQALLGRLTAKHLGLDVAYYDPSEHYENARGQWFGTE